MIYLSLLMFHFPEQFTTFSLITYLICRKQKSSRADFLKCNWCFKQLGLDAQSTKFPGNRSGDKHLFREDINSKVTLSFGHCPNHLNHPSSPPPSTDPISGNLVLLFQASKFKTWKTHKKRMFAKTLDVDVWGQGRHINDLKNSSKFKTYALQKK